MDDKSLVGGTLTSKEGLREAFESPNLENYDALGDSNASHSPSLGDRRVASGRSTAEMTENISALDRPSPDDLKAVTDSNATCSLEEDDDYEEDVIELMKDPIKDFPVALTEDYGDMEMKERDPATATIDSETKEGTATSEDMAVKEAGSTDAIGQGNLMVDKNNSEVFPWQEILIRNLMDFKSELRFDAGIDIDLEYNEDILNFESLLEDAGVYPFIQKETTGIDAAKHFLYCFLKKLYGINTETNIFFDTHVYLRMIWIMDKCKNIDTMLQAFVLAACECKRGPYEKQSKPKPTEISVTISKQPRFFLHEILKTKMKMRLDWHEDEAKMYTVMGFTRDINSFRKGILAKENIDLDDSNSNPTTANMASGLLKTSYYYDLSTYAKLGRKYRLETKIYQRMMKVICSSFSLSYVDVLKAFLMSMCKYKKTRDETV